MPDSAAERATAAARMPDWVSFQSVNAKPVKSRLAFTARVCMALLGPIGVTGEATASTQIPSMLDQLINVSLRHEDVMANKQGLAHKIACCNL